MTLLNNGNDNNDNNDNEFPKLIELKNINIVGRRSINSIGSCSGSPLKRAASEHWDFPEHCFTYSHQFNVISRLYLNAEDDGIDNRLIIIKELLKKISGYKRQDIDKTLYNKHLFISLEQLTEKLLCSKLKCFYCKLACELIYKTVLSRRQWTLDRIDNDLGHNADNVVICCLDCNIKRGTMDSGRFKYGKQLTFTKVE